MEFADIVGFYFSDPDFFKKIFVNTITYYDNANADLDVALNQFIKNIFEYELFKVKQTGYLYCLSNEMFEIYGADVYKLGMTNNMKKRMTAYVTPYLEPCKIHKVTKKLSNCKIAEDILFYILDPYRIKSNREFFKCPIELIKRSFLQIERIFDEEEEIIYPIANLNIIKLRLLDMIKDSPKLGSKFLLWSKKADFNEISGRKNDLMRADADIHLFETIIDKRCETIHEKNIIIAKYIRDVFRLHELTDLFLNDLGQLANVKAFNRSLIYLANDNYRLDCLEFFGQNNFSNKKEGNVMKQENLVRKFIKLFWRKGLLDNSIIKVLTRKGNLTDEHKLFITENLNELEQSFVSLRRKKRPSNTYQLITWLDSCLIEFFGGFVHCKISEQKNSVLNNKRYCYYYCQLNVIKYLELVIHKQVEIISEKNLNIIYEKFKDVKGVYGASIKETIDEFNKDEKHDYKFIDEGLYLKKL